jgi:hypothetical protein
MDVEVDGDKLCLMNGDTRECFKKISGEDDIFSKCDGLNSCEIETTNAQFYCKGTNQLSYSDCKINDMKHGSLISGENRVYTCISKTNGSNPSMSDMFDCQLTSMNVKESLPMTKDATVPMTDHKAIQKNETATNKNAEKIKLLFEILDEKGDNFASLLK